MPWMEWDKVTEKKYENGIRKTVLFPYSKENGYKPGVPWNGVTGITEQPGGAEETALWADDDKYISYVQRKHSDSLSRLLCHQKNSMNVTELSRL